MGPSGALFLRNHYPSHDVINVYSSDASTSPKGIYLCHCDNLFVSNHNHIIYPGGISYLQMPTSALYAVRGKIISPFPSKLERMISSC